MRKGKKKKSQFKESIEYIIKSRNYIYLIVFLFLVSSLIGFLFNNNFIFFNQILKDVSLQVEGLGLFELIVFILQNNMMSSLTSLFAGILLGIIPIFGSLFNGALLGYVYSQASKIEGLGIIWMLLPHGIFELPAVFISLGLGVKLGMFFLATRKKKELYYRFGESIKAFLFIVLPLLIIAAVIEGFLIYLS